MPHWQQYVVLQPWSFPTGPNFLVPPKSAYPTDYPFDYAASEFGVSGQFNPTKLVIDLAASIGMVSDRKRATAMWKREQVKRAEAEAAEKAAAEKKDE